MERIETEKDNKKEESVEKRNRRRKKTKIKGMREIQRRDRKRR